MPSAIMRMFEAHCVVLALRRALFNAGRRIPIRTAMIPMTTSSSTSVNAFETSVRPRGRL